MNRRLIVVIGILVFGIILAFGIISMSRNAKYNETAPKETEAETLTPVGIDIENTDKLAEILLLDQYTALRAELVAYLQSKYPKVEKATITSDPVVAQDGSISFKLSVPSSGATLDVVVQRAPRGMLVLSIPKQNFTKTIDVFNATTAD